MINFGFMNFDHHRGQQLNDHLRIFDCECEGDEFCEVCDPAEYLLRREEEKYNM